MKSSSETADEPSHRGRVLNFVIDASVALAWCFHDETDAYSEAVLDRLVVGDAVVPELWTLEVCNVLSAAVRESRVSQEDAAAARAALLALPIAVDPTERRRAFTATTALAERHGLTAYDATYLELARRRRIPLATRDGPLRRAAEVEGVELFGEVD